MFQIANPWPVTRRSSALALLAVFVIGLAVLQFVDHVIIVWANALPGAVHAAMHWVTRWGESDWQLIPAAVLVLLCTIAIRFLSPGDWRAALGEVRVTAAFVFLAVGVPSLTSSILKRLIGRARPSEWTAEAPLAFLPNMDLYHYQGFPSGHTTVGFAMAWVLAFLWPRALVPALGAAALIGASRILLGQHYLTDVIGGAVLGTLGAYAFRLFFAKRGWLFERGEDGLIIRKPYSATRRLLSRWSGNDRGHSPDRP